MFTRCAVLSILLPTVIFAQDYYDPYDADEMVYEEDYNLDGYAQNDDHYPEDDYFYMMCEPYNADCDEMWYWEDEATYPTKREDSWIDDLTKPW